MNRVDQDDEIDSLPRFYQGRAFAAFLQNTNGVACDCFQPAGNDTPDTNGVMACFTEKAAIMGTGPGEIWSGPDEIKVAYEHFFEGFDKGEQKFEYQFKIGGVTSEMGWLMTAGNVNGKKDGKEFAFPLNLSLTVAKKDGKWLIAAMHFSTLTGGAGAKEGA